MCRLRVGLLVVATVLIAATLTLAAFQLLRPAGNSVAQPGTQPPSAQSIPTTAPAPSTTASCSDEPLATRSGSPTHNGTTLDPSGILLVPLGEQVQAAAVECETFNLAFDQVLRLAMAHPTDFGYPWLDPGTTEVLFSVATSEGWNFAAELGPTLPIPYAVREVDHTYAELQRIQDDVTYLRSDGVVDAELIFKVFPDQRDNRTLIVMSGLSRPLLDELAMRFGAEALAVQIDPNPPPAGY